MIRFNDDRLIALILVFILILPVSGYSQEITPCNNGLFVVEREHALFYPDQSNSLREKFNIESYTSFNTGFYNSPDNDVYHSLSARPYFTNFLLIPYHVGKEITRLDKEGLERNMFFLSVFAATLTMDLVVRDFVQDNIYAGDNFASEFLYGIGNKKYFLPAMVGLYGVSHLLKEKYFHDTMLLAFQSIAISQLFTEISKNSVMRARPRNIPDDPFVREKGYRSFLSGHASGAWSIMTVFAGRYPGMRHVFYGMATLIALSRLYEDAHWSSDVFMGSMLGYGVGRLTLKLNQTHLKGNVAIAPFYNQHGRGIMMARSF